MLDCGTVDAPTALDADLEIEWFSGTGKGGQHRNKHQNSCRVRHVPSGIVETRQGRKRAENLSGAKAAIAMRLRSFAASQAARAYSSDKREQVGTGMRADKSVTIRFQDNRVTHHGSGKTMRANRYMRGFMDEVWP